MEIEIQERPAQRLATVRHVGPYHRVGEAFAILGRRAAEAGLGGPGSEMLALYHDDPKRVPANACRADAALTLAANAPLPEGVVEQHLPAGRYACFTLRGSYAQLNDAWERFFGTWLPASGERRAHGPHFEIYRSTPSEVPETELLTELYIPLA
ncbi:MAG TPA: GyrI-like domain-containing protein [Myxococcaceae bacterium]|nr:GyrI-like domain-containing protein [Myxococcaceae bacterium]